MIGTQCIDGYYEHIRGQWPGHVGSRSTTEDCDYKPDAEIGRFIATLKERSRYARSLIVFHADHGESLDEHAQYLTHGNDVFEPCLRIPLIVKLPDGDMSFERLSGTASSDLVSVLDISPTVVALTGLQIPESFEGRSLFQRGIGHTPPARKSVFVESLGLPYHDERSVAVRGDNRKLCYFVRDLDDAITHRQLFRLDEDPDELHNVLGDTGGPNDDLEESLRFWLGELESYSLPYTPKRFRPPNAADFILERNGNSAQDLDEREIEALRKLGYVD